MRRQRLAAATALAIGTAALTWGPVPEHVQRPLNISPNVLKHHSDVPAPRTRAAAIEAVYETARQMWETAIVAQGAAFCMGWIVHRGGSTRRVISLTISANTVDYNVYSAAGSPVEAVDVIVSIDSGVTVYGNSGAAAFFTTTSFASSSTVRIVNAGYIKGVGGFGGDGGGPAVDGAAGSNGGNAIDTRVTLLVDNTNGFIFGGGGGGGGGGGAIGGTFTTGGGGGGGGRGFVSLGGGSGGAGDFPGANGFNGSDGNSNAAGGAGGVVGPTTGGNGGFGGDWATAGTDGGAGSGATASSLGGAAGTGGKAIALNGNAVTWFGGNNSTQVKGAVS